MRLKQFDDAHNLIEHAAKQLPQIKAAYEASLHRKEVTPDLLISVKNYLENLRSALDFTAVGLVVNCGTPGSNLSKIHFPYAMQNQNRSQFSNQLPSKLAGVCTARPDIATRLETYQHFSSPENDWLPLFAELNNANKHRELTPQTREETPELEISSGGMSIKLSGGASISMGSGTSIQMGGLLIPGGQTIRPDQPARAIGQGQQKVTKWVSFKFTTIDREVISFLGTALVGITKIVDELSSI